MQRHLRSAYFLSKNILFIIHIKSFLNLLSSQHLFRSRPLVLTQSSCMHEMPQKSFSLYFIQKQSLKLFYPDIKYIWPRLQQESSQKSKSEVANILRIRLADEES